MNYTLDSNAAKQADKFFARIEQKGKYFGRITRAEAKTFKTGAKGVELSFKADSGESAEYLQLVTHNKDGEQISGFNTLMAIMTCLGLRSIEQTDQMVEKYNHDTRQTEKVRATVYPGLVGKPIGLLIKMEEYQTNKWKPIIQAPFDSQGFTASEILAKVQQPEKLEKMLEALRDKPLQQGAAQSGRGSGAPASAANLDDDIPF